jgi:hypothetical protein
LKSQNFTGTITGKAGNLKKEQVEGPQGILSFRYPSNISDILDKAFKGEL